LGLQLLVVFVHIVEECVMKNLFVIGLVTVLAGCAVAPPNPGYANQAAAQPRDPSQWHVVSVTPVPAGTAARVAAGSPDGKPIEYSTSSAPQPVYNPAPVYANAPVYAPAPVYGPAPVYAPAPVYVPAPAYYWPPVTLSLGFMFGHHWSRGYGGAHFRGGRRW
jgi:hypothetical protein